MVIGLDEVGRGPIAGPLLICAVGYQSIPADLLTDLNDSKKLPARKRAELARRIMQTAPIITLAWVTAAEIDQRGMSCSLRHAFESATTQAIQKYQSIDQTFGPTKFIIDGSVDYLRDLNLDSQAVVKADGSIPEVSAASIVAKHVRDSYMKALAKKLPNYGFERHSGYGTKAHFAAIGEHGLTRWHRQTFLKRLVTSSQKLEIST